MATKKLSLLLVGLLTCGSQPALTQGGGAGAVVLVPVVRPAAQRARPGAWVVK